MTFDEFKALDYNGRMMATKNAVCIAGREIDHLKILLYQMNDFYIEVFYCTKSNYIAGFVPFNSTAGLEPYLENISLAGLYNS